MDFLKDKNMHVKTNVNPREKREEKVKHSLKAKKVIYPGTPENSDREAWIN